jgi:DNA-binding PadR family transcriptional regulator
MGEVKLSELEGAVLGVIWRRGPCSVYVVRKEFAASTSTTWRASAGSIYPLVAKLEALDLVTAEGLRRGSQEKRLYTLTSVGTAELQRWITAFVPEAAGPPPDPIRTRAFFLDVLPTSADRADFIGRAQAETQRAIDALDAEVKTITGPSTVPERAATLGAVLQLQARLRWLDDLSTSESGSSPSTAD